jgi:hypothetical protein
MLVLALATSSAARGAIASLVLSQQVQVETLAPTHPQTHSLLVNPFLKPQYRSGLSY